MISEGVISTPTTATTTGSQKRNQRKMLTYGCGNVMQYNAAVVGGGGGGFGPPASETNKA